MYSLILTVVSIALFAAFALVAVNYINPHSSIAHDLSQQLNRGLYDLEVGYDNYVTVNGSEPSNLGHLTPDYAFTPPDVFHVGASWTLSPGAASGRYVCLSGTINKTHVWAAEKSQLVHSPQAFFINSGCGATSNTIPVLTGSQTQAVAITYWLSSY